ncbi:MAG: repeat-containing protein [Planctomycetaceae bacterium]|nr:repeat-containing protein [Planctomycetaceae bacterium]
MLLIAGGAFLQPHVAGVDANANVDIDAIKTVLEDRRRTAAEKESAAIQLIDAVDNSRINLLKETLWQTDLRLKTRCAIALKLIDLEVPEGLEFLLTQYDLYRLERRMTHRWTLDPVRDALQTLNQQSLLDALEPRLKVERDFRMQNNIRTLMEQIRLNQSPMDKLQEVATDNNWPKNTYRRYQAIEEIGRRGNRDQIAFLKELKPWITESDPRSRDVEGQNRVTLPEQVNQAISTIEARERRKRGNVVTNSKPARPVEVRVFRGHRAPVRHLAVSPDGKYLISVAYADTRDSKRGINEWIVWDVATAKNLYQGRDPETRPHWNYAMLAAEFLADNHSIVSVGKDALIWNCKTGETMKTLGGEKRPFSIVGLSLSPNRKSLLGWWPGAAGQVAVWDLASGNQRMLNVPDARVGIFLTDDRLLLSGGNNGNRLRTYDFKTEAFGEFFNGESSTFSGLRLSPDGQMLAATQNVHLWDVSKAGLHRLTAPQVDRGIEGAYAARFTPDNRYIAVGRVEGDVSIVDRKNGKTRLNFIAQRDAIYDIAFLPDGAHLLTAGGGGSPPYADEPNSDYAIRSWQLPDLNPGSKD